MVHIFNKKSKKQRRKYCVVNGADLTGTTVKTPYTKYDRIYIQQISKLLFANKSCGIVGFDDHKSSITLIFNVQIDQSSIYCAPSYSKTEFWKHHNKMAWIFSSHVPFCVSEVWCDYVLPVENVCFHYWKRCCWNVNHAHMVKDISNTIKHKMYHLFDSG